MKRRSVLKAGLATSLLPLLGFNGIAKAFDVQTDVQLKAILSDARFPASNVFAAHAAAMDIPHLASKGDITGIWLKHLDPLWCEGKASVMGLTTHDQLFCLERLAWDRGMKVLMRVEHQDRGGNDISHRIVAPPLLAEKMARAVQGNHRWPAELAFLLGSCSSPQLLGTCTDREISSKGTLDEHLVTWVIGPASRAT